MMAVMPMGWNWALAWCQQVLQAGAAAAGLGQGDRLEDGRRGGLVGPGRHVTYVDNLAALGTKQPQVQTVVN